MTRDSACRRAPAERRLHVLDEAGLFHGRLGVTRRSTQRDESAQDDSPEFACYIWCAGDGSLALLTLK